MRFISINYFDLLQLLIMIFCLIRFLTKFIKYFFFVTLNWLIILINNEIYLYKMLTMNLLQAMLVKRAE